MYTLKPTPGDERAEQKNQHESRAAAKQAQQNDDSINLAMKYDACYQIGCGPKRRSSGVREKEAPARHFDSTGERIRDQTCAWNEFCEEQGPGSAFHIAELRLADAGVGLERKPAEQIENGTASPTAQFVPEHVAEQGGDHGEEESEPKRIVPIADGSSHDEQHGVGGKGNAALHGKDVAEQECVAVEQDKRAERGHFLQLGTRAADCVTDEGPLADARGSAYVSKSAMSGK